jgi:hypothetical protein
MTALSHGNLFRVNEISDKFEEAWQEGDRPRIEDFLGGSSPPLRDVLLAHLLGIELNRRRQAGECPCPEESERRFPDYRALLESLFGQSEHGREAANKAPGQGQQVTRPLIVMSRRAT